MTRTITITISIALILLGGTLHAQENFPFVGEVTGKNVHVRAGQSTNYESLCRLPKGSKVVVVEKKFSWYKIKLPSNADSYISAEFIHRLTDSIGEVTATRLNIRSRATDQASVIGQLRKGAKIRILESKDGWFKIDPVEGIYGWISEDFVQFVSESVPPPKVVEMPSRNIYHKKRVVETVKPAPVSASRIEVIPLEGKAEPFTAVGVLELVENINLSGGMKFKLSVSEYSTYFITGGDTVLDHFLGHKVRVEGILKPDANIYPVIQLNQVKFIL